MKRKRYFTLEQTNKMIKEANKRIKIDIVKENVYLKDLLMQQKEVLDKIKEYCNNRLQYYNEMRRDYMREFDGYAENDIENILELLEEIE